MRTAAPVMPMFIVLKINFTVDSDSGKAFRNRRNSNGSKKSINDEEASNDFVRPRAFSDISNNDFASNPSIHDNQYDGDSGNIDESLLNGNNTGSSRKSRRESERRSSYASDISGGGDSMTEGDQRGNFRHLRGNSNLSTTSNKNNARRSQKFKDKRRSRL